MCIFHIVCLKFSKSCFSNKLHLTSYYRWIPICYLNKHIYRSMIYHNVAFLEFFIVLLTIMCLYVFLLMYCTYIISRFPNHLISCKLFFSAGKCISFVLPPPSICIFPLIYSLHILPHKQLFYVKKTVSLK